MDRSSSLDDIKQTIVSWGINGKIKMKSLRFKRYVNENWFSIDLPGEIKNKICDEVKYVLS